MQISLEDYGLAYYQVLFIDLSQNGIQSTGKSHIKTNVLEISHIWKEVEPIGQ